MSTPTSRTTDPAVAAPPAPPAPPADADLERLRHRLAAAAEDADLVDVGYTTTDSPFGPLLLAATRDGLVRLAFAREDHDAVLVRLAERISPRVLRAPARLDAVRRQLDEYFAGRRRDFAVPLDLRLSSGFRRTVLEHLRVLPYARTETYTEVARATASPRAVRAVGSACATNPVPVVVPCHRVLRSDGSPGGYVGGLEVKAGLLALEARTDAEGYRRQHR